MNKITYKRPVPIMKVIFGIGLFVFGIMGVSTTIFSPVLCGIATYLIHTDGLEINLDLKIYRNIMSYFGLNFGQWKNLPEIDYISVFKTTETSKVWASSASANISNTVVKVNLFYNTNQKIEAYNTQNINDAFEKAKQIASILNIDILDATERESKWL